MWFFVIVLTCLGILAPAYNFGCTMFTRKILTKFMIMYYMYIQHTAYQDASKFVRSMPRCNMALKRSVSGNGTFAVK